MKKLLDKRFLILLIVLAAAFLRLFRIEDYMTFLGDEGRDVIIVREILHGEFTLLGPRTSAADFYTGPIYYYMMAPFLFLFNYNPVGPAVMIALLGTATVYLIYRFGREWIGENGAFMAAALYAVSPVVISFSRSSWNPNPMPFFSMLIFYLLYKAVKVPKSLMFLAIGFLYGIAFQLHYIEIFVGVAMAAFILFGNLILRKKEFLLQTARQYALTLVGFIAGISPFLAFEVRHGFPNTKTVFNFIVKGDPDAADLTTATFPEIVANVFFRLFARLVFWYPSPEHAEVMDRTLATAWGAVAVITGIISVILILKIKDKLARILLSFWLFFGVVLFGFYHKPIYDYYFEFMFPLPFLLVGNLLSVPFDKKKLLKYVGVVIFIGLVVFNLQGNPFIHEPNRQYRQVEKIAKFIIDKAEGRPFNFALLTLGNSDHGYRYIFEVNNQRPVILENTQIDPERKSATDQLFVVCEDPNCEPLGASLWEVAGFGRAEIAGEWQVSVVKVYKLVPYEEEILEKQKPE